jgi:hypothetical protein
MIKRVLKIISKRKEIKEMRKLSIVLLVFLLSLIAITNIASAVPLPSWFEIDLDDWSRLYRNNVPIPIGAAPAPGDVSKAILTFNDISPTIGPGGPDLPPIWVGGLTDGSYLHGWESNLVISSIVPQGDGSVNMYFSHATADPLSPLYWEFVSYNTDVSTLALNTGANFLPLGPANIDTIMTNIATPAAPGTFSNPFMRGRFSAVDYLDPVTGLVTAVVGLNIPSVGGQFLGGSWINQVTTPYGLAVNTFVDVDPTFGQGFKAISGFYGSHPILGDPYDLALQNIRLFSELGTPWVISDDGVRGAVPEPATILLLGGGLIGLAGFAKIRSKLRSK